MIAIGQSEGIQAVFGATIACGLFMILAAPFFSQLLRFFPPIVTGTVILIIGLSLMRVAAGWIIDGSEDGAPPINVAFAMGTLLLIVLIERFAPPALQRVSVLLGLVLGTIAALFVPGDGRLVGSCGCRLVRARDAVPLRPADVPDRVGRVDDHRRDRHHDRDDRRHDRRRRDRREARHAPSARRRPARRRPRHGDRRRLQHIPLYGLRAERRPRVAHRASARGTSPRSPE